MESTVDTTENQNEKKFTFMQIVFLTGAVMSAQFMYSYTFALTAPLSRQLNFSKTWTQVFSSFGPISGGVIQPLIGILSDKINTRIGKRRPFIIAGQVGTALALIIQILIFNFISVEHLALRRGLFVLSMILCNVFVQAIQGPGRTLIADLLPRSQQVLGNAIATGMLAFGAITCNLIGFILSLHERKGFFQLEVFVPFISLTFAVLGTVSTCLSAHETQSQNEMSEIEEIQPKTQSFLDIFRSIKNLDRKVLFIAFLLLISWSAYYPFQYNATNYYAVDLFDNDPNDTDSQSYKKGVGYGMLMLGLNNIVTLISGFFNQKFIDRFGPKIPYAFAQITECGIFVGAMFYAKIVDEKTRLYVATILFALVGMSQNIFNIVPYTIVGLSVPKAQMGMIIGALNIFVVSGQLVSGTLICPFIADLDSIHGKLGPLIAIGAPFALIAVIMSLFIKLPEKAQYQEL